MKKVLSLIALIMVLMTSVKAEAQTLTVKQFENEISKQVIKTYKNYTDADLSVKILQVPFSTLNIKDGVVTYKVTSNNDKFMPRDVKKVEIFVNGKYERFMMIPVEVKAYKNVLVASEAINRESAITAMNTVMQRKEVSNVLSNVITNGYLKKDVVSKKMYKEGEIIDKRFLAARPDVARNQEIVALFKSSGVTISITAISQSEGNVGDYVMLKSPKYQRVYRGKVIAPNRVLVIM